MENGGKTTNGSSAKAATAAAKTPASLDQVEVSWKHKIIFDFILCCTHLYMLSSDVL